MAIRGAMKMALQDLLKRFICFREVDWKVLRGSIKSTSIK